MSKDQNELDIFEEQINEMVKEYMMKVLTSTPFLPDNLAEMQILLYARPARIQFAAIIWQDKFKQNEKHLLNEQSFYDLYKMIFTFLLHSGNNPAEYEDVKLITKATFNYYKYDKHSLNYYIYQEFSKRQGSFSMWLEFDFWKFWVENDITNEYYDAKKENIEEFYFKIILLCSTTMLDLNVDFKFIISNLLQKIAITYIKNVY